MKNIKLFPNSFGEKMCMDLCAKYIPYINAKYDDIDYRGSKKDPQSNLDEEYFKYDQIWITTGIEEIDGIGLSALIVKETRHDPISIKFYCDTVAYNGYDFDEIIDIILTIIGDH